MPAVAHRVLGEHLVGRPHACRDARAGVRDAHHLEQLLDGAVLAVAAVQRDERDLGLLRGQPIDEIAPTSIAITSWPSRSSASCTLAPDFSETWRSSERPPLSTATLVNPSAYGESPKGNRPRAIIQRASALPAAAAPWRARRRAPRVLARALARRARRPAGRGAGERPVQHDLLADDLPDPADPLADLVLVDAGEVQPHRRATATVDVRGTARDERDVLLQRARQQIGRIDVVGERRPDEQAALRMRPLAPPAGSARRASPASRLAGGGRSRSASGRSRPTARNRSRRRRSTARSTRSTGPRPACRCSSSAITGAGAAVQPSRTPGDRIFENVPA